MSRPIKPGKAAKPSSKQKPKASAFDQRRRVLEEQQQKLMVDLEATRQLVEDTPRIEAERRRLEMDAIIENTSQRVIRLDGLTMAQQNREINEGRRKPRRTRADKQLDLAKFFLLALICLGVVLVAVQMILSVLRS